MKRRDFLKTAGVCGFCSCAGMTLLAQEGASEDSNDSKIKALEGRLDFARRRFAMLIEILGKNLKPETRDKILEDLGRECAKEYKAMFEEYKNDLSGFLKAVQQEWAERTEYDEENGKIRIVGRKTDACFCPLVKKGVTPIEACSCSVGWQKEGYRMITGKEVDAKVEESVLRGGDRCSFAVELPRE